MCSKDCKKLGMAAVAAIILFAAMEYVFHEILLKGIYLRPYYQHLWNTAAVIKCRMPVLLLGYIGLLGTMFAKIYSCGYEPGKPVLGQGLRYGLWMGLLCVSCSGFLCYSILPVSWKLAGAWALGGMVECLIAGMAVAFIYRPRMGNPKT